MAGKLTTNSEKVAKILVGASFTLVKSLFVDRLFSCASSPEIKLKHCFKPYNVVTLDCDEFSLING
uniref:Uncharacterized protein n=1 Tax=Romanomermis culicivorax TaxID=13658 RepID=A0A915L2C3_ROMCU